MRVTTYKNDDIFITIKDDKLVTDGQQLGFVQMIDKAKTDISGRTHKHMYKMVYLYGGNIYTVFGFTKFDAMGCLKDDLESNKYYMSAAF